MWCGVSWVLSEVKWGVGWGGRGCVMRWEKVCDEVGEGV